jgi:hypothetical protein
LVGRRPSSVILSHLCAQLKKSLLRVTLNSTMSATFTDISTNEDSEDLVVVDTGSTVSILGSNFTSNSVTSAMLVLRSNGTAIYEQITLTKNKGGTSEAGMLQSVEGSTLSLKRVDAISNTFDVRYLYNYVSRAKNAFF